jgi:hypothetical protein
MSEPGRRYTARRRPKRFLARCRRRAAISRTLEPPSGGVEVGRLHEAGVRVSCRGRLGRVPKLDGLPVIGKEATHLSAGEWRRLHGDEAASWTVNVDPLAGRDRLGQPCHRPRPLDKAASAASIYQPPRPNGVDMRSPIKKGGCNDYQPRAGEGRSRWPGGRELGVAGTLDHFPIIIRARVRGARRKQPCRAPASRVR